ncbi:MAG: HAD family phosphatase [Patescibacteria group bacterium]
MIKAIIFDYFGVIGSVKNHGAKKRIAEAFGVTEETVGPVLGKLIPDFRTGRLTEIQFFREIAAVLGKPLPENTHDIWRAGFQENLITDKKIMDFIKQLKARDLKMGILSNTLPPWAEIVRNNGGFTDFDSVVLSCEVGLQKPDPKVYELALDRLGVRGEESLFVDDKEENLEVARSLGMRTVLAESPDQIIQDINTAIATSHSRAE